MFNVMPITSLKPTDCGATCLQMLLKYYDIEVPLENLIKDCRTSITGCSAKDILVAGRKYGLDMKAFKMDVDELLRQDRPSICWWKFKHFVILCGTDEEGKVVICNPDKGRYRMSKGTFKSFFTDVCLFNGEPEDLPE